MGTVPTATMPSTAYQANVMNALRATGPVVSLDSHAFQALLARNREALVVHAPSGFLRRNKYLMSYKGLFFTTSSPTPLDLPRWVEVLVVRELNLPY